MKCSRQNLWKKNTHFVFRNFFFFFENRAVFVKRSKNSVERGRPQMTIWRMRIACWTPEATKTHPLYVILVAFPQQQKLQERASMLRYKLRDSLYFCPFSSSSLLSHRQKNFTEAKKTCYSGGIRNRITVNSNHVECVHHCPAQTV